MDRKPAAYMVPLCLVLGFSPIAFLVGLVVPDGAGFFAVSGVGIFIAAILLIGAWSVLGTGRYLTRLTASHLAGIVIAACCLFAVILRSTGIGSGPGRFVFDAKVVALMIPPISVAVQLPFWFFRALFGWQLIPKDGQPELAFSLREIFTFTFVVALALATPQMSANLSAEPPRGAYTEFDGGAEVVEVINEDGTVTQRTESAEEFSRRMSEAERNRRNGSLGRSIALAFVFFVSSILAVPAVLFVFRPRTPATGCLFNFVYSLVLCMFFGLLLMLLSGGQVGNFIGEIFVYLILLIGVTVGAVAISLSILRANGFKLTSPKRFDRDSKRKELEAGNESLSIGMSKEQIA